MARSSKRVVALCAAAALVVAAVLLAAHSRTVYRVSTAVPAGMGQMGRDDGSITVVLPQDVRARARVLDAVSGSVGQDVSLSVDGSAGSQVLTIAVHASSSFAQVTDRVRRVLGPLKVSADVSSFRQMAVRWTVSGVDARDAQLVYKHPGVLTSILVEGFTVGVDSASGSVHLDWAGSGLTRAGAVEVASRLAQIFSVPTPKVAYGPVA